MLKYSMGRRYIQIQNMNWIDKRADFVGCITRGSHINFIYSGRYNYMD